MKKEKSSRKRKIIVLLLLAILGMAGGFWWGRGYALRRALVRAEEHCHKRLDANLTYSSPKWVGLGRVRIDWLKAKRDTTLRMAILDLEVSVDYWGWLTGGKRFREVQVRQMHLGGGAAPAPESPGGFQLPALPAGITDLPSLTRWIPRRIHFDQIKFSQGEGRWLRVEPLSWVNGEVDITMSPPWGFEDHHWLGKEHMWQIRGHLDPSTLESRRLLVGPVGKPWKFSATLLLPGKIWKWKCELQSNEFEISDSRLSRQTLKFPAASLNLSLQIAGDGKAVWLEEGSVLKMRELSFGIGGCRYEAATRDWGFQVRADHQSADGLMAAVPQEKDEIVSLLNGGVISVKARTLPAVKVSGGLDFEVVATFPAGRAEDLDLHFGRLNLGLVPDTASWESIDLHPIALFRKPFDYHPERSQRVIRVDRRGSGYTKLGSMSRFLPTAVLIAEDPNFRTHQGVDTTVLRKAIADNLADGKFSRGGSTITMQLVKNTHLTHGKTLYRKLNQVLLASMVEHTPGVTKDDILELYLNLIEWGPDKYGIQESAAYFFDKKPSALTLDECLFLACIIPNPKQYRSLLDEKGQPTEGTITVIEMIKFQMWEAGDIDNEGLDAPIQFQLSGRALAYH